MGSFNWKDMLGFEKLIAVKVIKLVYWLGIVGIVLVAISSLIAGLSMMQYSFGTGLGAAIMAVVGCAVGLLMWRLICEAYIAFFGIYDRLGELRDAARGKD